jgi:hypothetical protein
LAFDRTFEYAMKLFPHLGDETALLFATMFRDQLTANQKAAVAEKGDFIWSFLKSPKMFRIEARLDDLMSARRPAFGLPDSIVAFGAIQTWMKLPSAMPSPLKDGKDERPALPIDACEHLGRRYSPERQYVASPTRSRRAKKRYSPYEITWLDDSRGNHE